MLSKKQSSEVVENVLYFLLNVASFGKKYATIMLQFPLIDLLLILE